MGSQCLLEVVRPVAKSDRGYSDWLEQKKLLDWLEHEKKSTSVTLYGSAYNCSSVFVHSVFIQNADLDFSDPDQLTSWEGNPLDSPSCGLVYGGGGGARVELSEPWNQGGCKAFRRARQLVYSRAFDGYQSHKSYFELAQELTLSHGLHWVEERKAWCRLDNAGDIAELATIAYVGSPHGKGDAVNLSFNREMLDMHMAATDSCLVQMFESTCIPDNFYRFSGGDEKRTADFANGLVYKYRIDDRGASYFRGVQIIRPQHNARQIGEALYAANSAPKSYSSFITQDFKNNLLVDVSCAPESLASYFEKDSSLPFQTSPVFFKPGVLDKYKADPDKYKLDPRSISCRNAWCLQTYDFNDAGQVHTLIKYLGDLPYTEQLYWKSFNENPKAPISRRSLKTDFEGAFDDEPDGLRKLKSALSRLGQERPDWFILRERGLVDQLHYPLTSSNKAWGDVLTTLAKCVTEGLQRSYFEERAKKLGRSGDAQWGSIKWARELLEAMLVDVDRISEITSPLFDVQNLRTKLGAHSGGEEAAQIRRNLITEFKTPRKHIHELATRLAMSLDALDAILDARGNERA